MEFKERDLYMTSYKKLTGQLLLSAMLATGGSVGYLSIHQPYIHADSTDESLAVTDTQQVNFVDQSTGKVVGSQKLTLNSNGKSFADDTKLKLPSGYKRTDKFVYDLGDKPGKDLHYTIDSDGKTVWNVFVSQDSDDTVSGKSAKTVSATTTKDNGDGTYTVTTTVTTTVGSKTSSKTTDSDSAASNASSDDSSSTSSSSSQASATSSSDTSASSSSAVSKSDKASSDSTSSSSSKLFSSASSSKSTSSTSASKSKAESKSASNASQQSNSLQQPQQQLLQMLIVVVQRQLQLITVQLIPMVKAIQTVLLVVHPVPAVVQHLLVLLGVLLIVVMDQIPVVLPDQVKETKLCHKPVAIKLLLRLNKGLVWA